MARWLNLQTTAKWRIRALFETDSLADKTQRTVLNSKTSQWGEISAGVPQGSILGLLFFLMYINDLTVDLKCDVKLFADDTSIFFQLFTIQTNPLQI